jgi:signal transduction histidine kinase
MNTTEVKKMKLRLYTLIIFVNLILVFVTYKVMPIIQNYPPNSENIAFQKSVEKLSHVEQYIMIFVVGTAIHIFTLNKSLKNIYRFLNKYHNKEKISYDEIKETRKDCITVPYKFYLLQIIIVLVLGMSLTFLLISDGLAILKFFLMLLAITTLIEIIQFIFIQRELKNVMIKTYRFESKYEKNLGLRLNFSTNLILQIIPFIGVSIIIISLIGYAKATEEFAKTNASYYEAYLENRNFNNVNLNEIKENLKSIPLKSKDDYYFIYIPDISYEYTSKPEAKISDFFKKYLDFYFEGSSDIIYEFYGTEQQAYTLKLKDNTGMNWYIGFEYNTTDHTLMAYYIIIIIGALMIYTIFIYILAKNISNNIVNVSNSLEEILKGKNKNKEKIAIVSNDEIGDLSYYYNKIAELTEEHEKELKDNEYIMQRQAQFAILGEFAGGIAHDLNSPLSAIQSNVTTLKKYFNYNRVQADQEDKDEIINILNNIDSSIERMGNTIAGVRNQIRATGDKDKEEFSLKELIGGIEILFGSILRKNNCQILNKVNEDYKILGEKNKLDRVVGNVIKNSIDAYQEIGKNGIIEVNAIKESDKYIITIKDEAGGVSDEVKDILLKEMKTTKKENGTGFGLYYSNTIIESSFKGKMYFETTDGVGTIFYIELPINKEEN